MSIADWKNCVKFERFIRKVYSRDIWAEDICFYPDGKSFICKSNLNDQTWAPKTEEWRKTGEGLKPDYVVKVNKVVEGRQLILWLLQVFWYVNNSKKGMVHILQVLYVEIPNKCSKIP